MLLCPQPPAEGAGDKARPISIKAGVDRTSAHIGDRIKYTVQVEHDKDIEVRLPEFGGEIAGFSITDSGSSRGGFWNSVTETVWYMLQRYETGRFTIPGAAIKYRGKEEQEWKETVSDAITVEIRSMLDDTEDAEIRDIFPPVDPSRPLYLYISALAAAGIIGAAVLLIIMKRKNRTEEPSIPPVPAHIRAFEALDGLKAKDYPALGKTREYYFELSDIVRHYIEDRFQLKAPEMTTDEFLAGIDETTFPAPAHKDLLRDFLSHCDMVKFAKYRPEKEEVRTSYELAYRFIEQTKETYEGDNLS